MEKRINDNVRSDFFLITTIALKLFLLSTFCSFSQPETKMDSIQLFLDSAKNANEDTDKLEIYQAGIQFCKKNLDTIHEANFYLKKAFLYGNRGINSLEKENFYEAIALYEEMKTDTAKMLQHFYLAILIQSGDSIEMEHNEQALQYARKLNDLDKIASILNNMAVIHFSNGNIDEGLVLLKEVQKLIDAGDNIGEVATAVGYSYINLAGYYSDIKEYRKSIDIYMKADSFLSLEPHYYGKSICYFRIAYEYKSLNKLDSTTFMLRKGIKLAKEKHVNVFLKGLYQLYAEILFVQGNSSEAYQMLENSLRITDSLSRMESKIKLNERLLLKELEIQKTLARKDKELQEAELERTKVNYTLALLIIIAISVVLYLVLMQRKRAVVARREKLILELKNKVGLERRKLVQTELKHTKKGLNNLAIFIKDQNTFLRSIVSKITHVLEDDMKDGKENLAEIKFGIHQKINSSGELLKTNNILANLDREFLSKLDGLSPKLNKNERHLLSLIYIGLASKEIALILNISNESVDKKRYRLRKKMNVPHGVDFKAFINDKLD